MSQSDVDVIIAFNGHLGPPAEAVIRFLDDCGLSYRCSQAPLGDEETPKRRILGNSGAQRMLGLAGVPSPTSYLFDPLDLFVLPSCRLWIGLNPLASLRGLVSRRIGRAESVLHWSIDYSPRRFKSAVLEASYQWADYVSSSRCDRRVELTAAACEARTLRHRTRKRPLVEAEIIELGVWKSEFRFASPPKVGTPLGICFAGSHHPRMGIATLVNAVASLRQTGNDVFLGIAGVGPETPALKSLVRSLGIQDHVEFAGYIESETRLLEWISGFNIACAPYAVDDNSMTWYADPGKVKLFLTAGIPFVTTRAFSTAASLEESGCATMFDGTEEDLKKAVLSLSEQKSWKTASDSILRSRENLTWDAQMAKVFKPPLVEQTNRTWG